MRYTHISLSLSARDRARLEALRARLGERSWSSLVRRLIDRAAQEVLGEEGKANGRAE